MELPNDIWDKIVKQSKKNNIDIVNDMDLQQLDLLEMVIEDKKNKIYNDIKCKLDKYDIIEVFDGNNKYLMDCVLIDKKTNRECCSKICKLNDGNKKTIFGNYLSGRMTNQSLCLITNNIKVKSKLQDRHADNIKIANNLNIGDVFCYSIYTCAEWCKLRKKIYEMETFEDGLKYKVVIGMTYSKIITIEYNTTSTNYRYEELEYINKNKVLNKINYNDNQVEYIKAIKHLFTRCLLIIDSIEKDYLNNISKNHIKHIINKQKSLGVR